ncbi:DedA family protein/thiosulfate sulfurtransferase GlpE [Bordetella petrii]|uniref:DedA family protein/thiosulfate sulfurtransferase GlpE n=1 Tax=Bordetella petrii TaxID=94624 RepID=UPI001E44D739|nr:DedA family protein/thiosulfate sulfurtransferase GlpE [Bordetella petrii]MCD0502358.1 DedA family protein/thiosulfate sulfurtransferase GlpE [Bordetella petrii]
MSHDLIAHYGVLAVFLNVLGASLGLPLPVMPTLVTVGASLAIASGGVAPAVLSFAEVLGAAVAAGLLGDLAWYLGGKRYGGRTLQTVCKLSLSRETCIRKTETFFGRWGVRALLVARFVPGLSLVAVPLCGAMAIRLRPFIVHDGLGVALWASMGLAIGGIFSRQIETVLAALADLGGQALLLLGAGLALFMLYRYIRRRLLARALESARISVDELHALLDGNSRPAVLDIRSAERRALDPFVIPGSVPASEKHLQDVMDRYGMNRTLVIYCSCPHEVSAALMARRLRLAGVKMVLPLAGGIDAWRLAGFPVDPVGAANEDEIAVQGQEQYAH